MDITIILNNPITWLMLTLLHAACWAYAYGIVRRLRNNNPNHGQTAFLVIVGNSAVGLTLAAITWITSSLNNAISLLLLLLLANLFAGIPMIVEYIGSHTNQHTRTNDRTIAQRIIQDVEDRLR